MIDANYTKPALCEQQGLRSRLFYEPPSFIGVVLVHTTAMLQNFPIHNSIALLKTQIGLSMAELRREALIVHLSRKVMIFGEDAWLEIPPIDCVQSRLYTSSSSQPCPILLPTGYLKARISE